MRKVIISFQKLASVKAWQTPQSWRADPVRGTLASPNSPRPMAALSKHQVLSAPPLALLLSFPSLQP